MREEREAATARGIDWPGGGGLASSGPKNPLEPLEVSPQPQQGQLPGGRAGPGQFGGEALKHPGLFEGEAPEARKLWAQPLPALQAFTAKEETRRFPPRDGSSQRAVQKLGGEGPAKLVFNRYGDEFFLPAVRPWGGTIGAEVPRSKIEREYAARANEPVVAVRISVK